MLHSFKVRLFVILFLAGLAGVLSFLLIDLSALIALLPLEQRMTVPAITFPLKLMTLVQPTVLLALSVFAGVNLAPKVRLAAPFAEAVAKRSDATSALKPQIKPGIIGGLAGGALIVLLSFGFNSFLLPETIDRLAKFGRLMPAPTRFLYGGITEELLLRWGVMTLLVWLFFRLFQKRRDTPSAACFVVAILISSFVFGAGHLPVAFLLIPEPGLALIGFIVLANSVFGVIAGCLYWKRGLESAMIAHMFAHVVMLTAMYSGIVS